MLGVDSLAWKARSELASAGRMSRTCAVDPSVRRMLKSVESVLVVVTAIRSRQPDPVDQWTIQTRGREHPPIDILTRTRGVEQGRTSHSAEPPIYRRIRRRGPRRRTHLVSQGWCAGDVTVDMTVV